MTDSDPDPVEGERTRAGVAAAAPARAAGLAPADAFRRATRLALGAAGLALGAFEALLERHMPADPRLGPPPPPGPTGRRSGPQGLVRLLPAAAVGLGLEAERRSLDAAAAVGSRITQPLSVLAPAASSWPLAAARRRLAAWGEQGLTEQRSSERAAAAAVQASLRSLVAAVLDQIDLDRVVDRVDIDAIAARIDLDAIVERLDLPALAQQVLDELDVGQIVRESSSTMAAETVDALRVQGMQADRLLSGLVDRLLLRAGGRDTDLLRPPRRRAGEARP